MDASDLVRAMRRDAHLSVRGLGEAAGVAASTVHRIERGDLHPTVDLLRRVAEAAGFRLRVELEADYAASAVGLGRSIGNDVASGDESAIVRRAAEFAHRFASADPDTRVRMIAGEPEATGDVRWDAFLAALAEWLAVRAGVDAPRWTHDKRRYLCEGWWVTPMKSLRAWEYSGSPSSFQNRGIYLHRDSLTNV